MNPKYSSGFQRRIERRFVERIKSLGQIHGQILVAAKRTLQRAFNDGDSLIPVRARTVAYRRRFDRSRPHD